jgi:hypothetical protein
VKYRLMCHQAANNWVCRLNSKNARIFQGILQYGLFDRRKDEANICGIGGLSEANMSLAADAVCVQEPIGTYCG